MGTSVSPNFDLKNMISTYTKGFLVKKNDPNSPDFESNQNLQIFMMSSSRPRIAQEYRRFLSFFFLLSYLVCSQIWLNYFLDDYHFGYITKSLKETLVGTIVPSLDNSFFFLIIIYLFPHYLMTWAHFFSQKNPSNVSHFFSFFF